MANLKIELNSTGIKDFLRSGTVMALLQDRAETIQQRCGKGYKISTYAGRIRPNSSVMASSKAAIEDNLENNTLLKALK